MDYSRTVKARYFGDQGVQITIPQPNGKHIDRFLNRDCMPDLLDPGYDLKWDSKEISESESMLYTIRRYFKVNPKDDNVVVYVVGDGQRPRTGALFAFTTKWFVISIDPLLKDWNPNTYKIIDRLTIQPTTIEYTNDWLVSSYEDRELTQIVVAPHSHADLSESVKLFVNVTGPKYVVAMPCCKDLTLGDRTPDKEFVDWSCLSPERLVKVWDLSN